MNRKEKIKIGVAVAISLLFFGIFLLTSKITPKNDSPPIPLYNREKIPDISTDIQKNSEFIPVEENSRIIKTASLEISEVKYESEIEKETSVYDFMTKLQNEEKINFKDKNYTGMGKLIEEINGVKNGDKYWIYYVNGKKAQIGISNYKINPGDVVSWRYE